MIIVDGRKYSTIVDAAAKFGVSAKTVRSYIVKGVVPTPPTVNYGVRTIRHFPPEYIARAKRMLEKYMRTKKNS
jgi:DNA-binding transcriptional MerR regulator